MEKSYSRDIVIDILGREKNVNLNNGEEIVTTEYNSGLVKEKISKQSKGNNLEVVANNLDYTAQGLLSKQENSNGTVLENIYDQAQFNRLTQKITRDNSNKEIQKVSYEYDKVGNVLKKTDESTGLWPNTSVYSYDDLYRLISAVSTGVNETDTWQEIYRYSPAGNILYKSDQGTYQYPDFATSQKQRLNPDTLISIQDADNKVRKQFSYDIKGNVKQAQEYLADGTVTTTKDYVWSYDNRLERAAVTSVNEKKESIVEKYVFGYDTNGNRALKKDSAGTHSNYYPFGDLEEEIDTKGAKLTYGLYPDGQVEIKEIVGGDLPGVFFYHSDHLGSSSITTSQGGEVVQAVDYYPYGGVRKETEAENFSNDYLYNGKEADEEIGLSYYGARYYDAGVGRWVSEDPEVLSFSKDKQADFLKKPQSFNVFAYALNNPMRYVDPNGESALDTMAGNLYGGVKNITAGSAGAVVGLGTFVGQTVAGVGNILLHPIDSAIGMARGVKSAVQMDVAEIKDFSRNPGQYVSDVGNGLEIYAKEFTQKSAYEQGKVYGEIGGEAASMYYGAKVFSGEGLTVGKYNIRIGPYNKGGGGLNVRNLDLPVPAPEQSIFRVDYHNIKINDTTLKLPHVDAKILGQEVHHFPWSLLNKK